MPIFPHGISLTVKKEIRLKKIQEESKIQKLDLYKLVRIFELGMEAADC